WSPPHVLLLLGSVLVNYLIHLGLRRNCSRALFAGGVVFNLLLLGVFKYADFLIGNLNAFADVEVQALGLVLPLAISFYTFQQISFLHDTYRGNQTAPDFKRYLLFVTFFPQLIAGPIVLQRDTVPQFTLGVFAGKWAVNLGVGATLFGIGLFKKIVLADGIAPTANAVFTLADQGQAVPIEAAWIGALAYTFQIYFDFSGYCDMAIGLARMFGIRLPINFNSPYRSLSIVEFWRRWHITLSRFLRDYLYIPLGGNRSGYLGSRGNLMITMLLGGLWHGAGWNFVIWGGLHGTFLMINHAWSSSPLRSAIKMLLPVYLHVSLCWLLTFVCVVFAWVFFRAETFGGAMQMVSAMLGISNGPVSNWQTIIAGPAEVLTAMTALLVVCVCLPNSIELTRAYNPVIRVWSEVGTPPVILKWMRWRPSHGWALVTAGACVVSILQIYRLNDLSDFIYFNF
ncbi:MAG: MBOAT family protein, partial [Pseudomonadota bacterium]